MANFIPQGDGLRGEGVGGSDSVAESDSDEEISINFCVSLTGGGVGDSVSVTESDL